MLAIPVDCRRKGCNLGKGKKGGEKWGKKETTMSIR